MYRLMKSDKFTFDHVTSGRISTYRQSEIGHFLRFRLAHEACEAANLNGRSSHYYVLNELGQEYYDGAWID